MGETSAAMAALYKKGEKNTRSTTSNNPERHSFASLFFFFFSCLGYGASSNVSIPGNTLPSRSSNDAPPPVLQWVTLSSVS